jgi:hypothetical protein
MNPVSCFILVLFVILFSVLPAGTYADPLDNWHIRKVLSEDSLLHGITFGNGLFVTVGVNGIIFTSPNGVGWTPIDSGTTESLSGVTYGKNIYVAVGRAGTILTSPDGAIWTSRKSGTGAVLANVKYVKGLFIAVGGAPGIILTSPDGVTWTDRTPFPMNEFLNDVAFGNDTFIIVGSVSRVFSEVILKSIDGIHWSRVSQGTKPSLGPLIYSKNSFYSGDFFGQLWTTPNGIDWTVQRLDEQFPYPCVGDIDGIAYGNDIFVAVGSGNQCILTSPDGSTWTTKTPEDASLWSVTYGKGTFIGVGEHSIVQSDPFITSNAPPSQPRLVYPISNQNLSGTSVTFRWKESTDPENDAISYQLFFCDNADFISCSPLHITSNDNKGITYAGISSSFVLLGICGFFLSPVMVLSRRKTILAVALLVLSIALLISCGGGGGGSNATSASFDEVTYKASGLTRETTYYWKVISTDSMGAFTESEIQSFKTLH